MTTDVLAKVGGDRDEAGGEAAPLGSRVELDRLFRSQAPRLTRFFIRRTRRRDEAADLLQETFLRFLRIEGQAGEVDRPEAYLQRIASNLVCNLARRGAAVARTVTPSGFDPDAFAGSEPSPLAYLEAKDLLSLYQRALAKLRPKTREIFLLHRCDGLTYRQIASQMGLSVSGVERHMTKAIAHLDRAFGRA